VVEGSVDVVLARNSLDHVERPGRVLEEIQRVLRPGGTLILNFEVDHAPTRTEPHTLTIGNVRDALSDATVVREHLSDDPRRVRGRTAILVAEKN
jgi:ubiquinone/menaquinone biosynthesis C-methylase UbiE